MTSADSNNPWYKEFWAWFVFAPLILVVIASSITVTLAVKGSDDRIEDDYYKVGKLIDQNFTPENHARALGLTTNIYFEKQEKRIDIELNKTEWLAQGSLVLNLSHPVEEEKDRFLTLHRIDDFIWRAELGDDTESIFSERWYLRLSSLNDAGVEEWRLQGEINLLSDQHVTLN